MATPVVTPEDNSRERAIRINALSVPRYPAVSFFVMQGLRKWLTSFLGSEGVLLAPGEDSGASAPDAVIPTDATSAASLMLQLRQISDTIPPDTPDVLRTGLDVDAVLSAQRQILRDDERVRVWREFAHFVMATTNSRLLTEAKELYDLFLFPFEAEERAQQSRIVPRPTASWRAMLVLTATAAGATEDEAAALLGNLPSWYDFPSYTDSNVQSIPRVIQEVYTSVPDPRIRAFAAAILKRFEVLGEEGVAALPLTPGVLQTWRSLRDGTVARKFGKNDIFIVQEVADSGFSADDAALEAAKEAGKAGQKVFKKAWKNAPADYGVNQVFATFLSRRVELDKLEDLDAVLDALDDAGATDFVSETTDPTTADVFRRRHEGQRTFFFRDTITQLYDDASPSGDVKFPRWTGELGDRSWERATDVWQTHVSGAVDALRKPESATSPYVQLTKLSAINESNLRRARRTTESSADTPGVLIVGDDTPVTRMDGIAVVHWIGSGNALYITATSDALRDRVSGALTPILKKGGTAVLEPYSLWPTFNIENDDLKNKSALYVSLWIIEMLSHGFTAGELSTMPLLFHGRRGQKFYNYIVKKWVLTRLAL